MQWKFNYCIYNTSCQRSILKHYKVKHGHYGRSCPITCIYQDCACTFRTQTTLRVHLTNFHRRETAGSSTANISCELCNFSEACNIKDFFSHLCLLLRNYETVKCPFQDCSFKSNVLSTFKAHRSRVHRLCSVDSLRGELTTRVSLSPVGQPEIEERTEPCSNDLSVSYGSDVDEEIDESFECRFGSLFLRMQTILHVSKSAVQDIVEELCQIGTESKEAFKNAIEDILRNHNCSTDCSIVTAITDVYKKLNPFHLLTADGYLSITYKRNSGSWPAEFIKPTFRHDIALKLEAADRKFEEDGSLMVVSKDIKADVLEKLASKIYSYSAYPTCSQLKAVAQALVERHPCLKEPGSAHGYYGWTISLKFKIGNFRQRLRIAGCPELSVNSDKNTQDMGGKKRKLKKPRRSETNFLPMSPKGMTASSQEKEWDFIQSEVKKRHPDWALIDNAMTATFSMRRKEIVEEEPQVSHIKTRWPALFTETQIALEFTKLVSVDLKRAFFDGLDQHMPRLLELYADRKSEADQKLRQLMDSLLRNDSSQCRRAAALQGLPYFLREDPSDFLKICEPTVPEGEVTRGITVGIIVVTEKVEEAFLQPEEVVDVAVILEEEIVLQGLHDMPNAVATVMGLLYILNIDYPKVMKYTFETIQRVFMGIGSEACSAKVHGLKNKLLQ